MKLALAFVTLLWACAPAARPPVCPSADPPGSPSGGSTSAPATGYDEALAQRLGADELGMRKYVLAFLKAGPRRDQPADEAQRLMKAHLANIGRLAEEGKLVLAGPFLDDGVVRGIYVLAVESLEEAAALTATDPAIQAGRLEMELHPWYGSAALVEVNAIHRRVSKRTLD